MFNSNGWHQQDNPQFGSDPDNSNSRNRASSLSGGSNASSGGSYPNNNGGHSSQSGTSLFPQLYSQSSSFGGSDGNGLGAHLFGMEMRGESNLSDYSEYGLLSRSENATSSAGIGSQSSSSSSQLDQMTGGSSIETFPQSDFYGFQSQGGMGQGRDQWLSSSSTAPSDHLSNHQNSRDTTGAALSSSTQSSPAISRRNNGLGFDTNLGREFGEGNSSSTDLLMPSPEMFSSSQPSSTSSFDHWGLPGQLNSSQAESALQSHSTAGLSRLRRPSALKLESNSPSTENFFSNPNSASRSVGRGSNGSTRGVTPVRSMESDDPSSNGAAVVLTPQAKARYSTDFYPNPNSQNKPRISSTQNSNEPSPLEVQSSTFSFKPSPSFSETSRFEPSNLNTSSSDMFEARESSQEYSASQSQSSLRSSASHASLGITGSPRSSIGGNSFQGGGRQAQARPPISPTTSMSMAAVQASPSSTLWGAFGANASGGSNSRPSSSGLRSVASFTSSAGSGQTSASNSNSGSGTEGDNHQFSNSHNLGGLGIGGAPSNLQGQVAPPPMHRSHSSSASSWTTDSSGSSDLSYQNPMSLHHRDRSNSGAWKASSQFGARQSQDGSLHPLSVDVSMNMRQDSPRSTGGSLAASTGSYESSPNPSNPFASRSNSGVPDFDMAYHEAHLSAALAANQINSSSTSRSPPLPQSQSQTGGSSSSHGHEGHRTPTILEEEESGMLHQQKQLRAMEIARLQSQQQQLQLQHSRSQSQQSASRSNPTRPESAGSSSEHPSSTDPRSTSPLKQRTQNNARLGGQMDIAHRAAVNEHFLASLNFSTEGMNDCSPFIGSIVREYLQTPSRLGMGERTVLIMTSRVAQKSYGTEKRFLCPPPMVMVVGASWWTALPDIIPSQSSSSSTLEASTVLAPPNVQISISGETTVLDAPLEWTSSSGKSIDVGNPSSEIAISAKYLGKQLYITDVDDRKSVEALVHITVPGTTTLDRHHLGSFASRPIKVISKPSKKRQAAKGNVELCIHHGSTVSLFHRMRTQTVSTKYLGVSDPPTWFKGSDGRSFVNPNALPNRNEHPSCFVAKTSAWQPFIIYRVDPTRTGDSNASTVPPMHGYPPPPPSALPITNENIPIKFNQPVVLQCLHTAVVSPVMIIRKIEKSNSAVGGGSYSSGDSDSWNYKEAFGDSVAQLNKVAFELVENPSSVMNVTPGSSQSSAEADSSPGRSGPFLACLNDNVGMHKPNQPRKWCSSRPSTPPTPLTPMTQDTEMSMNKSSSSLGLGGMSGIEGTPPTSPTSMAVAYAAAQTRQSMSQEGRHGPTSHSFSASTSSTDSQLPPPSSDGGKVAKRPRRVSSLVGVQRGPPISSPNSSRGRKRGQSLSMVGMQNQMSMSQQQQQHQIHRTSSYAHSLSTSSSTASVSSPGASWSVDVGDQDVWTIVSADIASHTFYVPPRLVGGSQPRSALFDSKVSHLIASPAPGRAITPVPVVELVIPPQVQDRMEGDGGAPQAPPCVTLIGENFTTQLFVFFGDYQSERVEVHSSETIACTPPPTHDADGNPRGRVPVLLVRHDGIIFPTKSFFPPLK